MAKFDAAHFDGSIRGSGGPCGDHSVPAAIAEDPTHSERHGEALLEVHAVFQAEKPAQHSLATDEHREED